MPDPARDRPAGLRARLVPERAAAFAETWRVFLLSRLLVLTVSQWVA